TITHSHADGTLLDGTDRGDGTAEVLRPRRWRWSRALDSWYLPRSRDRRADRSAIAATADALRAQGVRVTVTIDDAPRPTAVVEADRTERARQRAARLEQRAAARTAAANSAGAADDEANRQWPPGGEPVKIGHHSQRRHEKALERSWATLGKAVEADRAAAE